MKDTATSKDTYKATSKDTYKYTYKDIYKDTATLEELPPLPLTSD